MPEFTVPVTQEVPTYAKVIVEADTLEEACMKVKADIEANGETNLLEGVEFTADWTESHSLKVDDVMLPDGRYRFPVDKIIAGQHGGGYEPENTALACHECNEKKGPNLAGVDPLTEEIVTLYNPRNDSWRKHFEFQGAHIVGLTPCGRATTRTLGMNEDDRVYLREELDYPASLEYEQ